MRSTTSESDLARLLQRFFYQRLQQQQHLSARTVASYRNYFSLLFRFAEQHLSRDVSTLYLDDLDASLVLAFLDHLESHRHNCIRSRNARFAAIRTLLHYGALQEPALPAQVQRVLAIPMKRFERPLVGFLSRDEMEGHPRGTRCHHLDRSTGIAYCSCCSTTPVRVSELISIRRGGVDTQHSQAFQLHGKGRTGASGAAVEAHGSEAG